MRRLAASTAAAVLGLTGVVALGAAMASQDPAPPTAPPGAVGRSESVVPNRERDGTQPARIPAPVLSESAPVRLHIPAIGVSAGFVELGVAARNGTLEVPESGSKVGWFTGAHTPGGAGVAVVAGHVTWNDAPSVFFRLAEVRPGDRVRVLRADGSAAVFSVHRVASFPKSDFPTDAVYRPTDRPVLRLVTCGGAFDESTQHYLDNTVVWAELVRSIPAD